MEISFDGKLKRLNYIIKSLEEDNLPLEQSVVLYKEGMELSKLCRTQIELAKNEVSLLTKDGLEPYEHISK